MYCARVRAAGILNNVLSVWAPACPMPRLPTFEALVACAAALPDEGGKQKISALAAAPVVCIHHLHLPFPGQQTGHHDNRRHCPHRSNPLR